MNPVHVIVLIKMLMCPLSGLSAETEGKKQQRMQTVYKWEVGVIRVQSLSL